MSITYKETKEFKEEDLQDMRIWKASRALETVMRELAEE